MFFSLVTNSENTNCISSHTHAFHQKLGLGLTLYCKFMKYCNLPILGGLYIWVNDLLVIAPTHASTGPQELLPAVRVYVCYTVSMVSCLPTAVAHPTPV